ncbi:peptidase M48, partial [Methylobacterium radiotolerans]
QALESALHEQRHMPERPHAFLELRHIWDTVPDAQRQQKREEYAARRARLDDSHPATVDRLQVVQAFPQPPALLLD